MTAKASTAPGVDPVGRAEGLEIGAVSVKWVARARDGGAAARVLRHEGDPRDAVRRILEGEPSRAGRRIVVTGATARSLLDLPYRSEAECIEKALSALAVDADVILSLGGETFSVYVMRDRVVRNITSTSKCAAGTGEFLVQQLQRMKMSLEEGMAASLRGRRDVKLATRCSVHCKSDATHKLNKGECAPPDIARALTTDFAAKIERLLATVDTGIGRIVIAGGVAQNAPLVSELRSRLPRSELRVLEESPYLEAFGAALHAEELPAGALAAAHGAWLKPAAPPLATLPPLEDAAPLLDYRVREASERKVKSGGRYVLGVDAGSTTTKAVLFNVNAGTIDASCYLRTHGSPVEATKSCLLALGRQAAGESISIVQAGTTGSGRELASVYLDGCPSFNEILAHARAAAEESSRVDTVLEIGGQDSKFISFLDGIPTDYAMNEGCSAGTGSFLEESAASDMRVPVKEISQRARASRRPLAFGERCAAFINTDVRNALQQGAAPDDVIAGLVYSVADNYLSRIVGTHPVGENLLFQGGVALNRAVGLAMAARLGRKIVVPPYPELMGALGTALMIRDRMDGGDLEEREVRLPVLVQGHIEAKAPFRCTACENGCEIQRVAIRDRTFPFGGLCSKFENERHDRRSLRKGSDLVSDRNRLLLEEYGPSPVPSPRGRIGIPMALAAWELLPLYARFVNELGWDVVLSEPFKEGNDRTTAAVCYPAQIAHGAVEDLFSRGADRVLLPYAIELAPGEGYGHGYTCPTATVIPDLVRGQHPALASRILSPHVALAEDGLDATARDFAKAAAALGATGERARRAFERALGHQAAFVRGRAALWERERDRLLAEPTVILAGRPYTTCAPEVNLAIPRKIASRGYHVVPADLLPPLAGAAPHRNAWRFAQQVLNAVAWAAEHPSLYVCLLSCFSCGPDASVLHLARRELAGRTFCYLEIDSHTAHAGIETRVGAFLDIIEEGRRGEASGRRRRGAARGAHDRRVP